MSINFSDICFDNAYAAYLSHVRFTSRVKNEIIRAAINDSKDGMIFYESEKYGFLHTVQYPAEFTRYALNLLISISYDGGLVDLSQGVDVVMREGLGNRSNYIRISPSSTGDHIFLKLSDLGMGEGDQEAGLGIPVKQPKPKGNIEKAYDKICVNKAQRHYVYKVLLDAKDILEVAHKAKTQAQRHNMLEAFKEVLSPIDLQDWNSELTRMVVEVFKENHPDSTWWVDQEVISKGG